MPIVYSPELRHQIITAYTSGEGSQRQLARRFKVSMTFIQKLWREYRTTGNVRPVSNTYQNFSDKSQGNPEPEFFLSDNSYDSDRDSCQSLFLERCYANHISHHQKKKSKN
ncbi:hypothetical protein [Calothrix sp. 336/3]|uniref:hypothetical protein n=1 Tax=Calothrix sp. 336/3 TaxID=1337936 RepID=UPI00118753B2|nr:hypothetical protein [Calothrix sp. 336/3]